MKEHDDAAGFFSDSPAFMHLFTGVTLGQLQPTLIYLYDTVNKV